MRRLALAVTSLIAACSAVPPAEPEIPVRGATPGFTCRNQGLDVFIGQVATPEVGAQLLRASGARVIRWVQPGMMVTMDYREDRLTVRLASNYRIVTANCG